MITRPLLVLLLAIGVEARAGVTCDFTTVVKGNDYQYSGKMYIDGASSRVDIASGVHPLFNPHHSIITRDGGKEIVVLDHEHHTFFVRNTSAMGGHLATARGIGKTSASRPHARVTREGERVTVDVSYRLSMEVEGERMQATVDLLAEVDASDVEQHALPWGLQFAAKTGFPDVDDLIARRLPARLPKRQVVSVSRKISDGPMVTESITTTVTNVSESPLAADLFLAPYGYRYEEPVFSFSR
jgi:hypothetical protein